ncbi:unnamed protein product [Rotaria sp. Silwood2]|nr:unnamed protein product [Rotaria sp. Silwood2]
MHLIEKLVLAFSLLDHKQKVTKDLSKESASFFWHQMLIDVLKQMPSNEESKEEMLNICRNYYRNNQYELNNIEEFRRNYTRDKAIEWYTAECFLYRLLNKALRTENIELLYNFRFFLIGLCAALKEQRDNLKDKDIFTVYRGTTIPLEEIEKLKENVGKIISTNGFLSTSRNIDVSRQFLQNTLNSNTHRPVLFKINVDPSLKMVIFANVENKTQIQGEQEVLFNLNSVFKIKSLDYNSAYLCWMIELKSTDECSDMIQQYLTFSKQQLDEYSPIIKFGRLLLNEMGQVNQAGKYFNMLLKSLPSDHSDIASVHNAIGNVYERKGEFNLALKNYELAHQIRQEKVSPDHPHIAISLKNMGNIYSRRGNFNQALHCYQKALDIEEKFYPSDHLQKGMTILNIGLTYASTYDLDTALVHLHHALEIYKRVLPLQHLNIAQCLGNIGYVHKIKYDFRTTLDYYRQQLEMEEKCLPSNHPDLSKHLSWIVELYNKMGKIDKAMEFCKEKLDRQKNILGETHPQIARILMILAEVSKNIDPNQSVEYYNQSLSILERLTPSDHQATAECLTSMACFYGTLNMFDHALQCQLKANDLLRQVHSSDHVYLAHSLRNIAISYEKMNNKEEALHCLQESLSIYQFNYGPEDQNVKRTEADIARLNEKQNLASINEPVEIHVTEDQHPSC